MTSVLEATCPTAKSVTWKYRRRRLKRPPTSTAAFSAGRSGDVGDGELAFDDTGGVSGTWVKESDRTPDERTRTYIMVDGIAETLKRIEAAGGRVLKPRTEIGPGMGRLRYSRIRSATNSDSMRNDTAEGRMSDPSAV